MDNAPLEANPSPAGPLLEMNHITKRFPGVLALDDVSFRVRQGEIHGLIGENGAGKSTLMKVLSGVYGVDSYEGELLLAGKKLGLRSPHDARREGIGVVPQELSVIESLTVAENVVVGQYNKGGPFVDPRGMRKAVSQFLASFNVTLDAGQLVYRLTAAQKQLVMIARALYANPRVLILDEPTSSLSLTEIANLFDVLRDLRARGVTCVFITHKLAEIEELADTVTVLRDGRVTGVFSRGSFTESDLIAAMVGRKIENLYPQRDSVIGQEVVLAVEHLTIPHPVIANRNLVEDVSFSLRQGEVLGLAGVVGAGRSEVVNALVGRMPHAGRILVNGKEVRIRSPQDAKRHGIALVTEDRKVDGLLTNMTVRPNITINSLPLISRLGLLDGRIETRYAADYREKLNIRTPSLETMITNLSGGNQQKVILARLLLAGPRILLMDEPTKGVDIGAKNEIYRIMVELVRNGISIIMISSELPELLAMCDRFVVLAGGRVQDEFPKSEASEYRVVAAATRTRSGVPGNGRS